MAKGKKDADKEERRATYDVPADVFVRTWQTSESLDEAAEKLEMPKPIASSRASKYRKEGVRLKRLHRGPKPEKRLDVSALNALIDKLERERASKPKA